MKYFVQKDKIGVISENDFNPKDILECGQIFRYLLTPKGYVVRSLDKSALIAPQTDKNLFFQTHFSSPINLNLKDDENKYTYYEIITKDVEYFVHFFDLDTDYNRIKTELLGVSNVHEIMQKSIDYASGIRILNQDSFEALISFVISQNNNIKRIQAIVEKLCMLCGTNMGEYYAFPLPEQLLNVKVEDLEKIGLGYRAPYILNAVKFFVGLDLKNFKTQSVEVQETQLLSVKGIGQKVCDCVMLFGFHNLNYFPVDTWNEKVYNLYFANDFKKEDELLSKKVDRKLMRNRLMSIFGKNSGIAQQYLFNYQRLNSGK